MEEKVKQLGEWEDVYEFNEEFRNNMTAKPNWNLHETRMRGEFLLSRYVKSNQKEYCL
jgi:hypothetical protein